MSRSNKSKIAVTLLGALAFGANAQAQDFSKNKIIKTDSFSIIKDSKLGGKSAQTIGAVGGRIIIKILKKLKKAFRHWK